jgi:hypothetical protein
MTVQKEKAAGIKVNIDGQLFAEAVSISGYWNGFAEPVFTFKEMDYIQSECANLGWDNEIEDGVFAHLAGWQQVGDDRWVCSGWIWEVVEGE